MRNEETDWSGEALRTREASLEQGGQEGSLRELQGMWHPQKHQSKRDQVPRAGGRVHQERRERGTELGNREEVWEPEEE